MTKEVRYRPLIRVLMDQDEDGTWTNIQYGFDWDDACQGEYDADSGDQIGFEEDTDDMVEQFMLLRNAVPALNGYPTAWIDGKIITVETVDTKPKKLPTCVFYNPSAESIEAGAKRMKGWNLNKDFPYGVCTNVQVVGPGGFGPCRADSATRMNRCNAYKPESLTLKGEARVGTLNELNNEVEERTIQISTRRIGQGTPHYELRTNVGELTDTITPFSGANAELEATEAWNKATNNAPFIAAEPKTKPFLSELVGACHVAED